MQPEIERCRREIADIEAQLRAGHPDVQGLCEALQDWHAELQMIQSGDRESEEVPTSQRTN